MEDKLYLRDMIDICTCPVYFPTNEFLLSKNIFEKRLDIIFDKKDIFFIKASGYCYGLMLYWDDKEYVKNFLISEFDCKDKISFNDLKYRFHFTKKEFIENYNSFIRIENDHKYLKDYYNHDYSKIFKYGYDFFNSYSLFRLFINKLIKPDVSKFQQAILKTIDNCYSFLSKNKSYYELDKSTQEVLDLFRNHVILECYIWSIYNLGKNFTNKFFNYAFCKNDEILFDYHFIIRYDINKHIYPWINALK